MSKASVYLTLGNVEGKHNVKEIKQDLDTLPGVFSVSVNESSNYIAVDFDTTGVQGEQIKKRLEKMGYEILDSKLDDRSYGRRSDEG